MVYQSDRSLPVASSVMCFTGSFWHGTLGQPFFNTNSITVLGCGELQLRCIVNVFVIGVCMYIHASARNASWVLLEREPEYALNVGLSFLFRG